MIWSGDFNFSFSWLKTSVLYKIKKIEKDSNVILGLDPGIQESLDKQWKKLVQETGFPPSREWQRCVQIKYNLAASFQEAICDILVKKTLKAVEKFWAKQILLSWWVSANLRLRELFSEKTNLEILWPKKMVYCTDNWAMIWAAAYFQEIEWKNIVEVEMW